MVDVSLVAFLGVLIGIVGRAAFPFLRKVSKEGIEVKWSARYTASVIASFLICLIVTAMVFPGFIVPEASIGSVFLIAFIFGFGFEALIIETEAWLKTKTV